VSAPTVSVGVVAVVPTTAVSMLTMMLLAGAFAAVIAALGPRPHTAARARSLAAGSSLFADLTLGRMVAAVGTGLAVQVTTGWPVLALVAAALVSVWRRLLRDERAEEERRRVEGIAKWLEDLRDTLRGSSVGTEEALEQVALRAPEAVRAPLATFVLRRRQGLRTEEALTDLADALAHPTSDAAIAAMRLVVTGNAGSGRLFHTVTALAAAARDEVRARERVDRTRAIYRTSMTRLVVIAAVLIVYLRFAAGHLLDPYGTVPGQLVLMLPLALWGGCIFWLRSLCRYEVPRRYRIAGRVS
jgi:tight adherence protein B